VRQSAPFAAVELTVCEQGSKSTACIAELVKSKGKVDTSWGCKMPEMLVKPTMSLKKMVTQS